MSNPCIQKQNQYFMVSCMLAAFFPLVFFLWASLHICCIDIFFSFCPVNLNSSSNKTLSPRIESESKTLALFNYI